MSNTNEKTLLVLGASSDICQTFIRQTASDYTTILCHYRSGEAAVTKLREEFGEKIIGYQCDFADYEATKDFAKQIQKDGYSPDHIILSPADRLEYRQFRKTEWKQFSSAIDVSLRSSVLVCHEFLPGMSRKKSGKILFLLSSCVIHVPPRFLSVYTSSKYALLGLMKSLAAEYEGKGICINAVSPEMVDTKYLASVPDMIVSETAENSLRGRNLYPEEVSSVMKFLLSEDADTISGQNIYIR